MVGRCPGAGPASASMEEMTHGDHDRDTRGPPARQAPNTPTALPRRATTRRYPPRVYAPGPYGPAPAGGYPPGPPQPDPAGQSRALAIWSIVFAFVFAPVGAVLGHLALGQIRRGLQRGRDLALVGLTLSYTFIVLTVAGLAMWMVTGANTADSIVADRPDVIAVPDPAHPETPSARPAPDGLTGVLLSLDELKSILKAPGLTETPSSSGESQGGETTPRPTRRNAREPSPRASTPSTTAVAPPGTRASATATRARRPWSIRSRRPSRRPPTPGISWRRAPGNGGNARGSPSASRRPAAPG